MFQLENSQIQVILTYKDIKMTHTCGSVNGKKEARIGKRKMAVQKYP